MSLAGLTAIIAVANADSLNCRLGGRCDTPGYAVAVTTAGVYAYVADGPAGLGVVDVSDPRDPEEVGHCVMMGDAYGVAVAGGHAFVACDSAGLRVVDISSPQNPRDIGHCRTSLPSTRDVAVTGSYAYVSGCFPDVWSGLSVVDVSLPQNPQEVGTCGTPGIFSGRVTVAGNYVYLADWDGGLRVIDVSDPQNPLDVAHYDTLGNPTDVAVDGGYGYVADFGFGLRVIDVSDPRHPREVGSYDTPGYPEGVEVAADYAYVADESSVRVIDISDPQELQEAGYYDTPDYAYDVAVAGHLVYVATPEWGLLIIDFYGAGVEERVQRNPGSRIAGPTVVRGTLVLPASPVSASCLLDAAGRRVMSLQPGPNDVSSLSPGVYFLMHAGRTAKVAYVHSTRRAGFHGLRPWGNAPAARRAASVARAAQVPRAVPVGIY